jgi:hypothetical protein
MARIARPKKDVAREQVNTQARSSLKSSDRNVSRTPIHHEHFHGVHFYTDERAWCRTVAEFLADGLRRHHAVVAIVTPLHHVLILEHLWSLDLPLQDLLNTQALQLLDAEDTLRLFMGEDGPDPDLFHRHVRQIVRTAAESRSPARVRACGEMVDFLAQQGRHEHAVRLEMLWNEVAAGAGLSLLCGYALRSFHKQIVPTDILVQHTHMMDADGEPGAIPVATA